MVSQEIEKKLIDFLRKTPDVLRSSTGSFIINPSYITICSLPAKKHRKILLSKVDNPPKTFGELADEVERRTPFGQAWAAAAEYTLDKIAKK